ncbi:tetratricopeptide (TPR) repeat protein [Desulfobaculum xiamenense]|uniref:Tetratricopeptide (TPR) repeat protein n=1 Tax=Desulfobaculum xiamenense TaxID=995050 RepID=A0A846QEX0_9BACT|nr:tetratricopeptide repeat protein [Desulfobaculum xiamenense]NJB66898.1 tetratricopeptide (TPR) repeat protein [Desulfobaculum xiamenense]
MQTKIKWFREVLELEPASKVFFPLARLYFEDGKLEDAVSALRQGLERNPEHVEARFLLVEILHALGRGSEAAAEVESITGMLSRYPAFWKVWAESCAPRAKDAALALSFLAANFQGRSISWSQVIERGLDSFYRGEAPVGEAEPSVIDAAPAPKADAKPAARPAAHFVSPEPAVVVGDEEEANLRTRTMADLLAEQGDYRGALDIYDELLAEAADDEEVDELEGIIANLKGRLRGGPARQATADESEPVAEVESEEDLPPVGLPGKEKLLHTLEALAERLEARAAL